MLYPLIMYPHSVLLRMELLYQHSALLRFKLAPIFHGKITFKITLLHRKTTGPIRQAQSIFSRRHKLRVGRNLTSRPLALMLGIGFALKDNQITL